MIQINNLALEVSLGVDALEQDERQKVHLDLRINGDFGQAHLSDDIEDTVNYNQIYLALKQLAESGKWCLLEKLSYDCARLILDSDSRLTWAEVRAKKFIYPDTDSVSFTTKLASSDLLA